MKSRFAEWEEAICVEVIVLDRARIKDFRLHDLRRTFASWYTMNGGDLNGGDLIENMVAWDGIEPRRPFQGRLPNRRSGLKSTDVTEGERLMPQRI
jgi:hypothetical protein